MNEKICDNRREFLVKSTATAGGLILSLAGINAVNANNAVADDLSVKIDDKSPLNKVGGSQVVDSPSGKVIIVHAEGGFKAYSAVCTHKGATIGYDEKSQMLVCPSHGSKFDAEGKNAGGPAKTPLPVYAAENSVVVKLK
ncbi:MAG TPA: Rieske (2Fe-2S) protein [Pyrinomonadaceae bacterium]|nr:Rieske (2Fe-2S) protein [Pyrinomonadaceae bacterium]